jgi:hypothetical protein
LLQGGQTRRPAPLRAPGKRSQLIPYRCRGEYGCIWPTHARHTDAPVVIRFTRITMTELAATNRWARFHPSAHRARAGDPGFPASRCGGALRIAPAAESSRPAAIAPPAARTSFAATSDSRDTHRCKARPERDCRAGHGPARVAKDGAEGAAFPRDVRGSKNEVRGAGGRPP